MRILIVTEIPAPFRIPLFNALAAEPGVELCAAFLAEHDPRRTYRVYRDEFAFREVVLGGRSMQRGSRWVMLSGGVLRLLRRERPDVVIVGGWNQPAFWEVLVAARTLGVPSLLWVESNAWDARSAPDAVRRLALRLATGALVPGRASRAYLESLGVPSARIFEAPNAVDFGVFAEPRDRDPLRERFGLDGCVFLYAGRFEHEKGLDVLLRAFADVPGQLVLIGSGRLEGELRAAADDRVRFVGQLTRDELAEWYAAADVLVLPSRSEPWGMTLNEAAAAGLPLVATEAVGAAHDLVDDGVNGFRVPRDDPVALAGALRALGADDELRRRAGERSREIAERFRPELWAAAVVRAARAAGRRSGG